MITVSIPARAVSQTTWIDAPDHHPPDIAPWLKRLKLRRRGKGGSWLITAPEDVIDWMMEYCDDLADAWACDPATRQDSRDIRAGAKAIAIAKIRGQ